MSSFLHVLLSLISCFPLIHSTGCMFDCYECPTQSQCTDSIQFGNDCVWREDFCEYNTPSPISFDVGAQSQISTSAGSGMWNGEDCFCTQDYYSSSVNTEQSCDCNDGMKALSLQYNGNTNLSHISFYHDTSLHIAYQECTSNDVKPGQIVQCTSFPYIQLESEITIVAVDANDETLCQFTIDTSCGGNILGMVSSGCSFIEIVGWVDVAHYSCGIGNRRRRRLIDMDSPHRRRRLLSSSSSDSSSSAGSTNSNKNKKDETITKTEPIPEEESPVVPLSTTPSPTSKKKNTVLPIFYDTTSTTTTTVTTEDLTTSSTTSDVEIDTTTSTGDGDNGQSDTSTSSVSTTVESTSTSTTTSDRSVITNAYCQCESEESWDDFHYYDEKGTLVILTNEYQTESYVIASNQAVTNQKVVSASDMMVHRKSNGVPTIYKYPVFSIAGFIVILCLLI